MGTRGTVSIRYKKECKPIYYYVHWDSYYSGLGAALVKDIRKLLSEHSVEELVEMFSKVEEKDEEEGFSAEEIKKLKTIVGPTYEDERKAYFIGMFVSKGHEIPDFYHSDDINDSELSDIVCKLNHSLCALLKFGKYLSYDGDLEKYNYYIDFCDMIFGVHCHEEETQFPLNDIPVEFFKESNKN